MKPVRTILNGLRVEIDGNRVALRNSALVDLLNVAGDAQRLGLFAKADEIMRQIIADFTASEMPLEALCPLPVRVINALRNERLKSPIGMTICHVQTIGDVIGLPLRSLRKVKNFGRVARDALGARLLALGLNMRDQTNYRWVRPLDPEMREFFRLLPTFVFVSEAEAFVTPLPQPRPMVSVSMSGPLPRVVSERRRLLNSRVTRHRYGDGNGAAE